MFSDSAAHILTLAMSELQMNASRPTQQPSLPPSPPPPPLSSLKPASTSLEQLVDLPDNGFDFYSLSFDNSFPFRGILGNELSFSCSSPTSNTSFLTETSFSTPSHLRNLPDSGNPSDSFVLLTNTSSSCRGTEANRSSTNFQYLLNGFGDVDLGIGSNVPEPPPLPSGGSFILPTALSTSQGSQMLNDSGFSSSSLSNAVSGELGGGCLSGSQWESPSKTNSFTPNQSRFKLPFSIPESTGIHSSNGNGSNASATSPTRFISASVDDPTLGSFSNQWNSSNVSSLLDNQIPESSCSSSMIITSTLGKSLWNTPSQGPSACSSNNDVNLANTYYNASNKFSPNSQLQDEQLEGLSKQDLFAFVQLLREKLEESIRLNDVARSAQIQGAMVQVQDFIIKHFVESSDNASSTLNTPTNSIPSPLLPSPTENAFDRAVKLRKDNVGTKDAPYTWSGQLPPRTLRNPSYSCKVFLGGLPWDINEGSLMQTFRPFGILNIEWPGKEGVLAKPKGYAYAVFENEKQVKLLLDNCTRDYNHSRSGNYYYKISSRKYRGKDVQVIPWALNDSNFNRCQDKKIDPSKTIFVGALHGMINAEGLAAIMQDLFGGVVYAGLDTDNKKYPIGSARVTFSNTRSYMKAVTAAFVLVKTNRIEKKLQLDPYLEDANCSVCKLQQGPYFCRDEVCFTYFCRTCFQCKHSEGQYRNHTPMMRTHNKSLQQQQQRNISGGAFNDGSNNGNRDHYQHSPGYSFGGGGGNNQHHNNHHNNGAYGFGSNNRSWGTSNNNGGGNSPPFNSGNGGGAGPPLIGMNGYNKKYMNGGGGGGQMIGGANNNNNNGQGYQQLPYNNRTFGHVGQQRQHEQYMNW